MATPLSTGVEAPGLARRIAAMAYEALLLVGVVFATALPFGVLTQTRHALDHRHGLQLCLFVVLGTYFTWFWAKGQTLAMKTWHIHLQRIDGQPVSVKMALMRYLFSWVWILPAAFVAWALDLRTPGVSLTFVGWYLVWLGLGHLRKDKQCWHDVLCGTRLVYIPPPNSGK